MKGYALCAIVAAALLGSAAYGGTFDSAWVGGSGNWSTANQWNPAGAPNNANGNVFDVTIASASVGGDSVLLDTSPTIDSLSIGGSGSPYAEALYTSGTSQTLTVNGAVIINSRGELNLSSGTLSAASLTNTGGFSLSGSSANATVTGNLTNTSSGDLYVDSGSLTVNGTLANRNANGNGFEIGGTVSANTLDNSGFANILNGGTLNLTNGITSVGSGSALEVDGSLTSGSGSGLAGLNSIRGELYLENGQTTNITPNGGTLNDSGEFQIQNNGSNATVVNVNGTLALAQGGYVTVLSGATLNLTNSLTDIPAGSGVWVYGTTNALAGLSSIEGFLYLDNGQSTTITPGGGTLAIAERWLSVEGSGTSLAIAGNLTNASSSSLFVAPGSTLTVNGTLANQAANGQYFEVDGTVNANTLNNSGYTHIVSGGTIYAGSVTNGSGATLTLDGASGSTPGGVLDPLKYTSGGSTSVGSGATLVVGSGTVPSGTTGLYAFDNGTLAELLFGSTGTNTTCTGSASDCGMINVAGNVTLSGTLDPLLQNGFDPMNGDSFIFLTFSGALSGQFSSIADQYFNNDTQQWVLTYGTDSVELTAEAYNAPPSTATPEPASLALFGSGLLGLGLIIRLRRKKS